MPICHSPIRELNQRLRNGKLAAEELARDAITQRERFEPVLGAYHRHHDELFLQSARDLDKDLDAQGGAATYAIHASHAGMVAGIPMSLKSVFGISGYQCYAGALKPMPANWSEQGAVVSHLRRHGALVSGTTHAAELSVGGLGVNAHWGTPRNPWDADQHRVPGGSSAGAAISVWEGSCAFALGTDTGGSVRVPASLSGLVGFKTSDARWPIDGVIPLASRFDTIGVIALRVDDVLEVVRCIDGVLADSNLTTNLAHLTLSDFRFMRASANCWAGLDPGILDAIETTLQTLCSTEGIDLAADDGGLYAQAAATRDNGPNTASVELSKLLEAEYPELLPHLSPHVAEFLQSAQSVSEEAYHQRVQLFTRWRREVHQRMAPEDIVVLPTVRETPPTLQQIEDRRQYVHYSDSLLHNTVLPSLNGSCAITLPVGLDAAGMPVGLQLVARAGAEYRLLRAAQLIERRIGCALDRIGVPPLCHAG